MTTEQMTTEQIIQQCKTLKELSTERAQYIRARTRLTNQMKAISRKHLCKGFQEKVSDKELNELIKTCMEDGTTGAGLVPLDISRINLTGNLQQIEREMRTIVRELPIWTRWASAIAGVGELTIGNIVGGSVCSAEVDLNTGEKYAKRFVTIGDYTNPAKLWKRWGVGVVDGQRQKRIKATDADKKKFREGGKFVGEQAKAIRHGYSPLRRAMLWNIGDSFVKQGKYYRRRYDQEKEKQLELYPEVMMDRNGTPKKKNYAKARAHNRAMRKATKLFLTDLWNKWREFHGEGPYHKLSTDRWEVPYP